jgi:hypothetical protein
MNTEILTHWKKNNDSRYISGEDLRSGLNGLSSDMVVVIDRFQDAETFDQTKNAKVVKTGFYLKTLDGKNVYKPVILNNTNAKFCRQEFGSEFMEHWLNKPFVLYAMPDKRHGFVARFKKYYPPVQVSDVEGLKKLESCKTLEELQICWVNAISKEEKLLPTIIAKKETLKTTLK